MAFTNGSPYVAPTRSATSTFSTLPLSLAAPANEGILVQFFIDRGQIYILYSITLTIQGR